MSARYFLTVDNSSHWYIVPVERREEWNDWREIPETDERAWFAPDYATAVDGAPGRVTFTDPVIA